MGVFECCHYCVPPKRYPGCHGKCPDYEAAKEKNDRSKAAEAEERKISNGLYMQKSESVAKAIKRQRGKKA